MSLKIFHLDSEKNWRGGEQQIIYLAEELEKAGHKNFIIAPPRTKLEEKTQSLGIKFFPLAISGEWDLRAAWRLRKLISSESPDILHCHSAHAHSISLLACLGRNYPQIIVSRRVDFPIHFKGKYTYKVSKIIAVSEGIKKVLIAGGIKEENLAVVRDGIDVDYFHRQPSEQSLYKKFNLNPSKPIVGIIAALAPHKDYPNFLQAAYLVHQKLPEAQFLIVGEGDEEKKIKELAKRLGVEGIVIFAGFRSDIPAVLSLLDIFVLASYLEGMGQALVEAMAIGLPIVATNVGGIPDVVVDGVSGFLVPPRQPEKLAEKIVELLQDKGKRKSFAEAGMKRAAEFNKQKMATETEKIYKQVLENGK